MLRREFFTRFAFATLPVVHDTDMNGIHNRIIFLGIPHKRLLDFLRADSRHRIVSVFTVAARRVAKLPRTRIKFGISLAVLLIGHEVKTVVVVLYLRSIRIAHVYGKKKVAVTVAEP